MKGRVLGSDGQGGTISGEDTKRYKFDLTHWKGERAPARDEEVDFEIGDDGRAMDIFPIRSALAVDFGAVGDQARALLGSGASSPTGRHIMTLLAGSALFQISAVILIASLLFHFVKISASFAPGVSEALPDRGAFSIVQIGDFVDYSKTSFEQAAAAAEEWAKTIGGLNNPFFNPNSNPEGATPFGNPQVLADKLRGMEGLTNLFYIFYLAPLGATVVLVQQVRRKSAAVAAFGTGIACIASFVVLFVWRSVVVGGVKSTGNQEAAKEVASAIQFGFGSYVILLCGVALLAAALGFIKLPQRTRP